MGLKGKLALWGPTVIIGSYVVWNTSQRVYNTVGEAVARNLPPIQHSLESFMMRSLENIDGTLVSVGNNLDNAAGLLTATVLTGAIVGIGFSMEKYVLPSVGRVGSSVRRGVAKIPGRKGTEEPAAPDGSPDIPYESRVKV